MDEIKELFVKELFVRLEEAIANDKAEVAGHVVLELAQIAMLDLHRLANAAERTQP